MQSPEHKLQKSYMLSIYYYCIKYFFHLTKLSDDNNIYDVGIKIDQEC